MKETETDNNVVRKTPEEIKKGLNVLYPPSFQTTYSEYVEAIACIPGALALIEQLEREKQALIYDIMNYGFHLCLTCAHCKGKYECAKLGTNGLDHTDDGETVIMRCDQYEWRGITEGKGGNVPEPPKE